MTQSSIKERYTMKVGVFTVLLADRPLEEALDNAREAGCEAVEIDTGGYPGDSHCDPESLLANSGASKKIWQAWRLENWRSAPSRATATRSIRMES